MVIRLIKHITPIILLFVFTKGHCQDSEISGYNNFRETVWLETERQLYISGEIIKFTASVLEQDTYQESVLSKNIRIELLSSSGDPISQQNLILEGSSVRGNLLLPSEARSGWFYIRAYTNWMRNINPDVFATRAIKVFNPAESEELNRFTGKGVITASLYPHNKETGLFIGYNEFTGLKADGWILDSAGDTLCGFAGHATGWTLLEQKIEDDESYTLSLEGIDPGDYKPDVEVINTGSVNIGVQKSGRNIVVNVTPKKGSNHGNIRLILHQSYTKYWESELVDINEADFILPSGLLPGGIMQFSVLDDESIILGKRLWSDQEVTHLNLNGPDDPGELKMRTEYSLDYSLPVDAESISVRVALDEPGPGLENYIPGLPGWRCTSHIPAEGKAFRGWLLANSYQDDVLYQILNPSLPGQGDNSQKHLPETRAGILEGKVINKTTGLGEPGIGVSVTVLDNNRFDATVSDQNGYFYFSFSGLEGTTDYILNFTTSIDPNLELFVIPEFEASISAERRRFYLNTEELEYLNLVNTKIQLNNIYGRIPEYTEPEASDTGKRMTFFHPPDHVTVLDDFIKLANIREIIYEVVPNVGVRNQDGRNVIRVNSENHFLDNAETLILLDGIPLADQTELLQLSTERIERIEVKSKLYIFGNNVYAAIVNFVSPNKDFAGLDLPENSILSSYNLPFRYIPPETAEENLSSNIPVLDEILKCIHSWSGSNNKIVFKTNDRSGKFNISISGFDKNGNWISGAKKVSVIN